MGILDKIFGKSERKKKEDKLVLFVNLLMNLAGADGERSEEEYGYVFDYASRYSTEITKEKWMEIVSKAESLGDNAMRMAIKLDQNEKIKLVEELIGLADSDGHFHAAEFTWIIGFCLQIGLDKDIAEELLKNHSVDIDEVNKVIKNLKGDSEETTGEEIDLTESENNLTYSEDKQTQFIKGLFDEIRSIVNSHVDMEKVFEEIHIYIQKFKSNKQLDESILSEVREKYTNINKELDLERQEKLYNETILFVSFYPKLLLNYINDFAYNQFEQRKYNEGLNSVAQSINLHIYITGSSENDETKWDNLIKLAGYLDTFSVGLYLKGIYEDALKISNILISLSPNDPDVSEHLTNRGKIKLKLGDKEGAKLDFEEALEKDEYFEEAKKLLASDNLIDEYNRFLSSWSTDELRGVYIIFNMIFDTYPKVDKKNNTREEVMVEFFQMAFCSNQDTYLFENGEAYQSFMKEIIKVLEMLRDNEVESAELLRSLVDLNKRKKNELLFMVTTLIIQCGVGRNDVFATKTFTTIQKGLVIDFNEDSYNKMYEIYCKEDDKRLNIL